jgi:hypothetical protein
MSTSEQVLIDRAVHLEGESLRSLRGSQKKWFIVATAAVVAYAVAMGSAFAFGKGGGLIALAAMPLVVVVFYAGRLAGRVEVVDRVRALQRP